MIASVKVTRAANLFALRIKTSGNVVGRVALLRDPVSNPDELFGTGNRCRRLHADLHLLIARLPIATLCPIKCQSVIAAAKTQGLRGVSSSLNESNLCSLGRSGIAAGKTAVVASDARAADEVPASAGGIVTIPAANARILEPAVRHERPV